MATGVLFLMLVLLALLLAAFIYQIVTTPLAAVDAPSLVRSAATQSVAAQSAPAPALPVRRRHAATLPSATGPASGASARGTSRRVQVWIAAALAIGGLAGLVLGGWLFLRIAHGAAICSHQAIEVCSQGFVLLTGTQLAGGAIAMAGLTALVIAVVLALR
jgi:hypothetical protein